MFLHTFYYKPQEGVCKQKKNIMAIYFSYFFLAQMMNKFQ